MKILRNSSFRVNKRAQLFVAIILLLFFVSINPQNAIAAGEEIPDDGKPSVYGESTNDYTEDSLFDRLRGIFKSGDEDWISKSERFSGDAAAFYGNANGTGSYGNLVQLDAVKAVPGQNVHGNYKKDTNSCASCHMTHSAPGEKILFRVSIYDTCTSCHDGTLGFYNVLKPGSNLKIEIDTQAEGQAKNLYAAGGGTFRGELGKGSSMHLATGSLVNNAAPGGNRYSNNKLPANGESSWGADFECSSCHAPHGSYSDRLLHYNPNNVGIASLQNGGLKREGVLAVKVNNNEGKSVYVVGKKDNASDVLDFVSRDNTPWIYGYSGVNPKRYYTKISVYQADGTTELVAPDNKSWNDIFEVNYGNAFFEITDSIKDINGNSLPGEIIVKMDIAPATVVKFDLQTVQGSVYTRVISYGNGIALSKFCAACHTDYNQNGTEENISKSSNFMTTPGEEENVEKARGTFMLGNRHNIDPNLKPGMVGGANGTMTCLTCHYAHGTTQDIMLNADNTFTLEKDINPSSALKRYVNQAVCFRCHAETRSESFRNSSGFDEEGLRILESYKAYKGY